MEEGNETGKQQNGHMDGRLTFRLGSPNLFTSSKPVPKSKLRLSSLSVGLSCMVSRFND